MNEHQAQMVTDVCQPTSIHTHAIHTHTRILTHNTIIWYPTLALHRLVRLRENVCVHYQNGYQHAKVLFSTYTYIHARIHSYYIHFGVLNLLLTTQRSFPSIHPSMHAHTHTYTNANSITKGPLNYTYPYGNTYHKGYCNEGRPTNPVIDLFGPNATFSYTEMNDRLLDTLPHTIAMGGQFNKCESSYGCFDMHGNVHGK